MEQWASLDFIGYPDYSVSDFGRVRNSNTGRMMRLSITTTGTVKVGLVHPQTRNQHTFGVAQLVAQAFVPRLENCRHVIHCDGDRTNCEAWNLLWRPWWFAKQYQRQFEYRDGPAIPVPIRDVATGEEYENSWDACVANGLLDRYVLLSVVNGGGVYPTGQHFALV